ncbi:MAG: DUF721 domain-containing protein [Microscillaceae bacterium]|nr:DUF721 domain-containing protein [Microscillaceae bacterium]MDW8461787.1 DUF721 domain-containing protein [Cytophagales bacterium]
MSDYNFRLERTNKPLSQIANIAQSIDNLLEIYEIKPALEKLNIVQAWYEVTGEAVKSKTRHIFVKNKKIFVRLASSPLKVEILMQKSIIIDKINQLLGQPAVDDLILF